MYGEVCLYDLLQEKKTKQKKKHRSKFQPPSRASTYDPNDTIPARTRVFWINELLYLILSSTSTHELGIVRRVCKKWNAVGHDINSIKFRVSPIRVHTDAIYAYPEYSEDDSIFFNLAITVRERLWSRGSDNAVCHVEFRVNCDFVSFDLRRLGCELPYPTPDHTSGADSWLFIQAWRQKLWDLANLAAEREGRDTSLPPR